MTARSVERAHAVLLAAWIGAAVWAWFRLPSRIPVHFDAVGRADAWAHASLPAWFFLPAVATGVALLVVWNTRVAMRDPEGWTIPDKERFVALPLALRAPVEERVRRTLVWVGLAHPRWRPSQLRRPLRADGRFVLTDDAGSRKDQVP